MGRGSVRAGAPTSGTTAVSGTDNDLTAPRIIIFDPPVRPCWIRTNVAINAATTPILVKVNTEVVGVTAVSDDFSTGAAAHHTLSDINETIDLSEGGMVAVHSVSFASQHANDGLSDVVVVGFAP